MKLEYKILYNFNGVYGSRSAVRWRPIGVSFHRSRLTFSVLNLNAEQEHHTSCLVVVAVAVAVVLTSGNLACIYQIFQFSEIMCKCCWSNYRQNIHRQNKMFKCEENLVFPCLFIFWVFNWVCTIFVPKYTNQRFKLHSYRKLSLNIKIASQNSCRLDSKTRVRFCTFF